MSVDFSCDSRQGLDDFWRIKLEVWLDGSTAIQSAAESRAECTVVFHIAATGVLRQLT
jgi:hypothetical protein